MAGVYVHVPFCNEKCIYCDFFSGNQLYLIDKYVDALVNEIVLRSNYLGQEKIDTIYFGGGTPSILNSVQIEKILKQIAKSFQLNKLVEITIECNPENISSQFLDQIYNIGVNRISLGVQFLDDKILSKFNRKHSKALIIKSLECLEQSFFDNISVDLIYAVPGISDEQFLASLQCLNNYDIKHFSAYSLTVAKNTRLFWKVKRGEVVESTENEFVNQYYIANDFFRSHGYEQYEVSNYAKNRYLSLHNLAYWNQIPYIGLGVSAHSFDLKSRQWNHTNIKKFIRETEDGKLNFEAEVLSDYQLYNEYIILKLRTLVGISRAYIKQHFSDEIVIHFDRSMEILLSKGHFKIEEDFIAPTQRDLLLADFLAKNLMI